MSNPSPARARRHWVQACHFHDLTETEVLREVSRRVSNLKKTGSAHPLVLLDLDSTLYEVGPRTFRILSEWKDSPESGRWPEMRQILSRMDLAHVGYSIQDTLRAMGVDPSGTGIGEAVPAVKEFWRPRFFNSDYLKFDRPYPGAIQFVRELHERGAELVYLTGRDEGGMGRGTREALLRDGFPWNVERTHLRLKAEAHLDDLEHKTEAAAFVHGLGTLVASFENEPLNLVALYELFPEAMHVFVDTVCSEREAMPCRELYRIRGFG